MKTPDKIHAAEWIVIAATVALIYVAYLFVLPRYFRDEEVPYIILVALVAGAGVRGSLWTWNIRLPRVWLTVTICGSVTAAILGLSLYVILHRQGP